MKNALVKTLEDLLDEKDPKKLAEYKKTLVTHLVADSERVMQKVNSYLDTRSPESREAIEKIIESMRNS